MSCVKVNQKEICKNSLKMSANLCCFHFLTRTRKKVEVAPAIENKADQKIPIQPESQITEEQAITKPPSPIEEIRTTTEIITNTVPINNIIKVIETQPQVSQTINIVTYQQKTESSDKRPHSPPIPRTPKRRFSLVLVPIAQAAPQTVIKLGIVLKMIHDTLVSKVFSFYFR